MQNMEQLYKLFISYLKEQTFQSEPTELYEPINYIMDIGGKRMRPLVSLMAAQLYTDDLESVLPVAYATELFHNFTLVHDDIMDAAVIRRGVPTVHKKYDTSRAILSGDVMLVYVYQIMEKIPDPTFRKILNRFNQTAIEVCEGQQMDMNFETELDITIDQYIRMIEYKTSVLLAYSLWAGAIAAGAPDSEAEELYEFGRSIGIAFQIQDDILDSYGDASTFGKFIGGDIKQNKKTYLLIKALETTDNDLKTKLLALLSDKDIDPDKKVTDILQIYSLLHVKEKAEKARYKFHDQGIKSLKKLKVSEEKKQPLFELANQLFTRLV